FPSLPSRVFGLHLPRPLLRRRIAERLDARLDGGLPDEVRALLDRGVDEAALERYGLEYRWVTRFVRGRIDRAALREGLLADIRRFAKRQETWFRRMERRGTPITWLDAREDAALLVERILRTPSA
ncbi:tRNA (adenosine(37)-N6)-dimethylallyltransferase MiaA, partial [bacterium]|nr:tRNA (adenosine(37)-N6)-dimethylallyltransferase MiaA [bacterium]